MKTRELRKLLELTKPGISNKEAVEQTSNIIFKDGAIYSFNDEIAIIAPLPPIPGLVGIGCSGAVPADKLYKLLGSLPQDQEIDAKIDQKKSEFLVVCGKSKGGVTMAKEITLPIDGEIIAPAEWTKITEDCLTGINQCLSSAGQDQQRPVLQFLHITQDYIESCDNYRMTRFAYAGLPVGEGINIPAKNLEKLGAYQPTECGLSGNWFHFRNKDMVRYCCRVIEGKYPNLEALMQDEEEINIEFPAALGEALNWAEVFADDKAKLEQKVTIKISRAGLVVRGEGPDGWEENDPIRMKYVGDPVEFQANPTFLHEMLKVTNKAVISKANAKGKRSLKIVGAGFVHIVSLN